MRMATGEEKQYCNLPNQLVGDDCGGENRHTGNEHVNCLSSSQPQVLKTIDGISGRAVLLNPNKDRTWIFSYESMDIYDEYFTKKMHDYIGFECFDMAIHGSHDVIATDQNNKRIILRISSSGSITVLRSTAPLIPYGICVNNELQIVVGGVIEGVEQHRKLVVYSSDGSTLLQEIEYDQSRERLFTGYIYRVKQTVNGDYVVADGFRIICLSTEWKVKWTCEFGPEHCVRALCCDMFNNILVGDMDKNEIVMLNKDGQRIRTLLTNDNGIIDPWSMDVDGKGRLWIGQRDNVLISTYSD